MYDFKFADIGEGIHEGIIHQWLVKEGDAIKDGQTLFLVETDKVTAEIPSPVNGKVHQILFEVGQTVNVGDVVVHLTEQGELVNVVKPFKVR
jgi:pyruvate dehydrogenase E2 component (dihydrolipoamide acetyltransferase)